MSSIAVAQTAGRTDAPGSISHGYSWVPPGLTRLKVKFPFILRNFILFLKMLIVQMLYRVYEGHELQNGKRKGLRFMIFLLFEVEEYMAQLPNHVVPRVNSNGEKFREKQLMLQVNYICFCLIL